MQKIKTDSELAGSRIDIVVLQKFPDLSRSTVQKLIKNGMIRVNNETPKPGHKLRLGEVITIADEITTPPAILPIDLKVIYEDSDAVVAHKPEGLLTHSKGAFNPEATVASWLQARVVGMDGERAGIVHRLDRATSGVIIGAKTPDSLKWLQKQFSTRKVKKVYLAVIAGEVTPGEAVIDMPIERNPKAPATFRVGANGKSAKTHYKVILSGPKYSLLELAPETGRTHQLRVHLAKIGYPIVGDTLYGGEPSERLFLHASSLELTLPSRKRKVFKVATPPSFRDMVDNTK